MGGKGKNKSQAAPVLKYGKHSYTVGTKFEAKDSIGKWYDARVLKVDIAKKQLFVHFNGWNSRYDVWLPPNSPRIRFPAAATKSKEKEWRIGDRVVAKWGPAGRVYPATVSRLVNETQVEITFYDGFKKVVSKMSLKPDAEKMYRQYDSTTARKTIVSPKAADREEKTSPQSTRTTTAAAGREKRRSQEPAMMADFVMTDIHGKRRKSKSEKEADLRKNKEPKLAATATKMKVEPVLDTPETPIRTQSGSFKKSVPEKLMDHCNIDLSQQKNNKYILFPKMDDSDSQTDSKEESEIAEKVSSTVVKVEKPKELSRNISLDSKEEHKEDDSTTVLKMEKASKQKSTRKSSTLVSKQEIIEKVSITAGKEEKEKELLHKTPQKSLSLESKEETIAETQNTSPVVASDLEENIEKDSTTMVNMEKPRESRHRSCRKSVVTVDLTEESGEEDLVTDTKVEKAKDSYENTALKSPKEKDIEEAFVVAAKVENLNEKTSRLSSNEEEISVTAVNIEQDEAKETIQEAEQSPLDVVETSTPVKEEVGKEGFCEESPSTIILDEEPQVKKETVNVPELKPAKRVRKPSARVEANQSDVKPSFHRKSSDVKQSVEAKIDSSTLTVKQEEAHPTKDERQERRRSGKSSSEQQAGTCKKFKNEKQPTEKSNKNFEQKYEMFKQKWRLEKEKRRMLKSRSIDERTPPVQPVAVTSTSANIIQVVEKPTLDTKQSVDMQPTPDAKPALVIEKIDDDSVMEISEVTTIPTGAMAAQHNTSSEDQNLIQSKPTEKKVVLDEKPKKGRPRKKKELCDISRTPTDTISFASMVSDERPSLINRKAASSKGGTKGTSKWKLKPESIAYDSVYKSYVGTNANAAPTLTQIAASKIQKKAHQKHKTSVLNQSFESEEDNKSELDLSGITLSSKSVASPDKKLAKRKNLDFITGRLKYKKKMEVMKAQEVNDDTNKNILSMHHVKTVQSSRAGFPVLSVAQPTLPARLISPSVGKHTPRTSAAQTPPPPTSMSAHHKHPADCQCWHCFRNSGGIFTVKPAAVITAPLKPPTVRPVMGRVGISSGMLTPSPTLLNVVPTVLQRKEPVTVMPKPSLPSALLAPAVEIKQEPLTPTLDKIGSDNKTATTPLQPRKRKNTEDGSKQAEEKKPKTEMRRTRRDSEKHLQTMKSDGTNEYKCSLPGCNKSFRKQHLLDYHLKYFHTAKPSIRRNRSSISISSTESNTCSALLSPVAMETSRNVNVTKMEESACSSNASHEVDVLETSDSDESESESDIATFDECVKCVCEDECELGFMIQCEQCFTWQHGECVGYLTQKNVPLFYLCHVCSKPKGLRSSFKYNNDYTWQRFGRIPPVNDSLHESKIADPALRDSVTSIRHVDKDDEEMLSGIMIASHAMVADLCNIKDVLVNIRQKFVMISNSSAKQELTESTPNEELGDKQLEDMLLQIDEKNRKQNIRKNLEIKIKEEPKEHDERLLKDVKTIEDDVEVKIEDQNNQPNEAKMEQSNSAVKSVNQSLDTNSSSKETIIRHTEHVEVLETDQSDAYLNINNQSNTSANVNDQSKTSANVNDQLKTSANVKDQSTMSTTTNDESNMSMNTNDQSNMSVSVNGESNISNFTNDQSEAKTGERHEIFITDKTTKKLETIKLEEESPSSAMDFEMRPFSSLEDLPRLPMNVLMNRESVIARYELFVEIERIEDEVEQRLEDLNKQLDLLEKEYNNIDRSKEILQQFQDKFQLPDMNCLSKFLNRIKWTSIMKEK